MVRKDPPIIGGPSGEQFREWMEHMGWSWRETQEHLGIGARNTIARYLEHGPPLTVALAMNALAHGLGPWNSQPGRAGDADRSKA